VPTTFSITFDGRHGLVLVAGETIVHDLVGVHIDRHADGTFSCAVTRGDDRNPVRLVASSTPEGRWALRANGRLSEAAPGFIELPSPTFGGPATSVQEDIARHFGWEPPAD